MKLATPILLTGEKADDSGLASPLREYLEVMGIIAGVTVAAGFTPLTHHALGHVYLLVVILLCLRVGRGPVLFAAICSALAWNYFFIPPKFSFQLLDYDDGVLLAIYFAVAIIAGQLTARFRAQENYERKRQEHATALYQLIRALASGHALDEALEVAMRQGEDLLGARMAILLGGKGGGLTAHRAGSLPANEAIREMAAWVDAHGCKASNSTDVRSTLHLPLRRGGLGLGVLVLEWPGEAPPAHELLALAEAFAAQISQLIEREQFRIAAEREKLLAESDRLHRTLLDCVSHELKTPLAVLRTAAGKLDLVDGTRRAGLTREIQTATRRLDRLVANLLDQARLESGALRAQLDWCDVRDLIQASRRAAGDLLDGRTVETEIPADMPLVYADAPLMEHAITNLLLNSAHHTPAGCPVRVSTGTEDRSGQSQVYLRVSDRGPGLPAELQERLFQKFCRGPRARPGGLGLGLSIVRGFMLAQGGDVTAVNMTAGAAFTLYLPYRPHSKVPDDAT